MTSMDTRRPRPVATTTVSTRFQTVVPTEVRERFMIREGTQIAWIIRDDRIEVVPLPDSPWQAFRGAGRDEDYLKRLEEYRAKERTNEVRP
jgi:AbrB family looped-hinge helix DNA binding protein